MGSPLSFCACIGTMNQIGTPLPALSPQGGERVAAGRERGGSWEVPTVFQPLIGAMNIPTPPALRAPLSPAEPPGRGEGTG